MSHRYDHSKSSTTVKKFRPSALANQKWPVGTPGILEELNVWSTKQIYEGQIVSTLADGGVMPIDVASAVRCVRFNADLLDGFHESSFLRLLFASTEDDTVENDTAETAFAPAGVGNATLAANSLVVGDVIRVRASGILSTV